MEMCSNKGHLSANVLTLFPVISSHSSRAEYRSFGLLFAKAVTDMSVAPFLHSEISTVFKLLSLLKRSFKSFGVTCSDPGIFKHSRSADMAEVFWVSIYLFTFTHITSHFKLGVRIGTTPGYFIIVPLLLTVLCASGFQQLEVTHSSGKCNLTIEGCWSIYDADGN